MNINWTRAAAEDCYDCIGRNGWEFESDERSIERFDDIIEGHAPSVAGLTESRDFYKHAAGSLDKIQLEYNARLSALTASHEHLARICRNLQDELADRYDGAPDSKTHWMATHLNALKVALSKKLT